MKISIKSMVLCLFAVAGMQGMQESSTISRQNERLEQLFEVLYQNGCGLARDFRFDEIQNNQHFLGIRGCVEELLQIFKSQGDTELSNNSSLVKLYRGLQGHLEKRGSNQLVIDAVVKQAELLEALEEMQKRNNDQQELLNIKNEVIGDQNETIELHKEIRKNLIKRERYYKGVIRVFLGVTCICLGGRLFDN